MKSKEEMLRPHFTDLILLEINYAVWLENGNLWLKVELNAKQPTDISLEFSLLHSLKNTENHKLDKVTPAMPNTLK